jgi:hypothetical protein
MNSATPVGPTKSLAVTLIGVFTILWGAAEAVWGGCLTFAGADLGARMKDDSAAWGFAFLLRFLADFMIVAGVVILLQGVLGIVAGLGVVLRKPWGRVLTFIMAVLAIGWGLLFLSSYQGDADLDIVQIVLGAAQVLYGILAIVILIAKGSEFSQPRV